MDAPVRRCKKLDVPDHKRNRGRPKKSWSEVIRHDRRRWRSRIKVVDSK